MNLETVISAALAPLVAANQVFPDVNDAGTAAPYIVYTRAGGEALTFVERATPSKENIRLRVTCWAATRLDAVTLAGQVQDALVALTTLDAKPIGSQVSLYDEDTRLRGAVQDFTVWIDR